MLLLLPYTRCLTVSVKDPLLAAQSPGYVVAGSPRVELGSGSDHIPISAKRCFLRLSQDWIGRVVSVVPCETGLNKLDRNILIVNQHPADEATVLVGFFHSHCDGLAEDEAGCEILSLGAEVISRLGAVNTLEADRYCPPVAQDLDRVAVRDAHALTDRRTTPRLVKSATGQGRPVCQQPNGLRRS